MGIKLFPPLAFINREIERDVYPQSVWLSLNINCTDGFHWSYSDANGTGPAFWSEEFEVNIP